MNHTFVNSYLDNRIQIISQRLLRILYAINDGDFKHHRYALWKRLHRLDLTGESCAHCGLDERRSSYHAESGGPELDTVLKSLNLQRHYNAVDIGSGKGAAVFTLGKYFSKVTGVELSERLHVIAEDNAKKLKAKGCVEFLCKDATTFQPSPGDTVFYLFNPFPAVIVTAVMNNLRQWANHTGQTIWIIYKNPVAHDEVVKAGFQHKKIFDFMHGKPCYIYQS